MKTFYTAIFLLAMLGCGPSAIASDTKVNNWQYHEYAIQFSGNLVKKEAKKKSFAAETIFTNLPDTQGNIAITCVNSLMTVMVAYEAIDMDDFVRNNRTSKHWRTRKIAMKIDGKQQRLHNWTYLPKLGVLLPQKKSDRSKIYNAAIRGQTITVGADFKKSITLNLPKPNTYFAQFGSACGLGNGRSDQGNPTPQQSDVKAKAVATFDAGKDD